MQVIVNRAKTSGKIKTVCLVATKTMQTSTSVEPTKNNKMKM